MKKSNKKQIPKVRLPKFAPGGNMYFDESAYDSSQSTSTQGTKDAYNEKRSKGANMGKYAQYGQAAMNVGMQMQANQGLNGAAKDQGNAQAINGGIDSVAGSATPWYGMAKGASNMGKGFTKQETVVDPTTGKSFSQSNNRTNQAFADTFTPMHETAIKDFSEGHAGKGVLDILSGGVVNTMDNYLNGTNKKQFDAAKVAQEKGIAEQQAAQASQQAAAQQQQNDFINNSIQSGMAKYQNQNQNSGTIQYSANGGVQMSNGGNGQINAEVEKEENSVAPNGQFTQFNGPSHAAGGIKTDIPQNSLIFSDKLKMPGTKKTFADLNKSNNTNKEDKILSSNKHGNISKHTAMLMSMAKNKNSETLFANQEAFKQAKVQAYAKRMGVTLPQAQEAPEEGMQYAAMGGVKLPMYNFGGAGEPVATSAALPTFNNRSQFDNYYKTQGWAPDPRNQSGRNLNYYDPKKYAYDKSSNTFSNVGGGVGTSETANFGSLPVSEFAEYKPGSGVSRVVNTTPTTANWQTNQLLRGGGNKLTYADGTTQMVAPKEVVKTTGFKYGGMNLPKFGNGVKFTPKMAQEEEGDDVIIPGNNGRNSGFDPNEVMSPDPYNTFNKPELSKWDAMRLNKSALDAGSSTPDNLPQSKSKKGSFDWNNLASNAATGLANNAGNIYNLSRYNKAEVEKYDRAKASYLDPTAAIRDADAQTRRAEYNVRGASGGNAGTYLSNRVALNTENIMNKDRIRQQYANANAGIANQNSQFNTDISMREVIANAQNRARNRSGKGEAIGSMGSNIVNQIMDNKKGNMDQETLQLMMKYYDTPEFQKVMKDSKYNKKKIG